MATPFDPPSARRGAFVPTRRASMLVGLAVVVFLVDLVIGWVRPSAADDPTPDSVAKVRATLQAVADEGAAERWLLVGDSVLAGDVMRGKVGDWTRHRVVDYLRADTAAHEDATFHQVALDGLLPVDMLRIVRELDLADPRGEVGLVLEINPRYFSRHYAAQAECSRPWLCELGADVTGDGWLAATWREAGRALVDHLPLARHRDLLATDDVLATLPAEVLVSESTEVATDADPAAGRARILEHYRDLRVDRDSEQVRALLELIARLRSKHRPALVFATPLADRFMAGTLDGPEYGAWTAAMDRIVTSSSAPQIRFVSLDHPSFADGEFIDHAHLWPAGNEQLALNLLPWLGVGMTEPPPRMQMAYPEGLDHTLVSRIEAGSSDGAPWQAQFAGALGVDVGPDGRVVIADTGNEVVREIVPGSVTVRTLAGMDGVSGHRDGPARWAQFDTPTSPVIAGDSVFVLDGTRRDVREITADGHVVTHLPAQAEWTRPRQLRWDGKRLYVLDRRSKIYGYNPRNGKVRLLVDTAPGEQITAFDVSPEGHIYLADDYGAVWQWHGPNTALLASRPNLLKLRYANRGQTPLPQSTGDGFPFDFERMSVRRITALEYVPSYDGVLVADEVAGPPTVTERVHLRFLSFRDRRIYPWLRPQAYGGAYMYFDEPAETFVSNVHLGSMALDPDSNTLLWLERGRARLLQLSDGLLGAAKIGHHVTAVRFGDFKDLMGIVGRMTAQIHHPHRNAHRRLERLPRRGPYFALMLGSSMTAVSDMVGQYSMGRLMEEQLQRHLGLRDGVRFDLVHRPFRGPSFATLLKAFGAYVDSEIPPDVVFFELHSGALYEKMNDEVKMAVGLAKLLEYAAVYDTKIIFLDNDAMGANLRDGLRETTQMHAHFMALARQAGIEVLNPSDLLLREYLRLSTWGSPPLKAPHGSPWAIEATSRAYADAAYPIIVEHLRDRVPAIDRGPGKRRDAEDAGAVPLAEAFEAVDGDWAAIGRTVDLDAAEREVDGRRMTLFVDLGKTGDDADLDDARAQALLVAFLARALAEDPVGRIVTEVEISLAAFANYDEYGVGQVEGATVVAHGDYDAAGLQALLEEAAAGG